MGIPTYTFHDPLKSGTVVTIFFFPFLLSHRYKFNIFARKKKKKKICKLILRKIKFRKFELNFYLLVKNSLYKNSHTSFF